MRPSAATQPLARDVNTRPAVRAVDDSCRIVCCNVQPSDQGCRHPIANLVYGSRGGADTVIVDGAIVMEAGVVKTIDEAATLPECQKRGEAIAARSGLAEIAKPLWPVL